MAFAIAAGCCAFGTEIAACSSTSAAPPSSPPPPTASCTDGGLTVAFNPMYSAFGGTHMFTVPAVVHGSNGNVTWSADSTMVEMQADSERPNEVLIQTLKAGYVIINVQSADGKCGSSLLTISEAKDTDWLIGNARYNNGHSVHLAGAATTGAGSPLETSDGGGPACTNCHGETATDSVFTNVSHTPEQTGGFSDTDLLNIILRGQFPDGGYFDNNIVPYSTWKDFHKWIDITPDQQAGIVTYLRSLTPASQKGAVNFGAFDFDSGSGDDQSGTVSVDTGTGEDATRMDAAADTGSNDAAPPDAGSGDATPVEAGIDAAPSDAGDGATE